MKITGAKFYPITPVPKPRQTRSDKWQRRDCVMRYRVFADECRLHKVDLLESGCRVTFYLPMPKSWSEKKKRSMEDMPHRHLGDIDNYLKALLDALFPKGDQQIYDVWVRKLWARTPGILIERFTTT